MDAFKLPSPIEELSADFLGNEKITLFVKRDDLIHPQVSGNKWRKLKWNIANAIETGRHTLLTFGGAHSNHIASTAAAAGLHGLNSIGIIRGKDADLGNPTLKAATDNGMELHLVNRTEFRRIEDRDYIEELRHCFGAFYLIPQGGQNHYGVQGCGEIMAELDQRFDRVFAACGTATTLSGMALANKQRAEIYGVSALKGGGFLKDTVRAFAKKAYNDEETEGEMLSKVHLLTDFHFGGYAKVKPELIDLMRNFYRITGVKTDPVYTGKVVFAMRDMARKITLEKPEKWLFIHSGGLQGIPAMEEREGIDIYGDC